MTRLRPALDSAPCNWLLDAGAKGWDLLRYGPPGFEVYLRIPVDPVGAQELDIDAMRTVMDTLADHTATPDVAFVCVWDGWGHGSVPAAPSVFVEDQRLLLFTGPVAAMRDAHQVIWVDPGDEPDTSILTEPDLVWPEDHAWCLACEVDEEVEFTVGCSLAAAVALEKALPGLTRRVAYGEDAPLLRDHH